MNNPHNLKVGQKLFQVINRNISAYRNNESWVTISKIGRKYAVLEARQGRVDLKKLFVDGGSYSSPAQCYLTKEEYVKQKELETLWTNLRIEIRNIYSVPSHCSIEDFKKIIKILKIGEDK